MYNVMIRKLLIMVLTPVLSTMYVANGDYVPVSIQIKIVMKLLCNYGCDYALLAAAWNCIA